MRVSIVAQLDKGITRAMCLMTMLVVTVAAPLDAGAGISFEIASAWGGPVNGVQAVGDVAFVAAGQRVVSLDISDPTNISEIGSLNVIGTAQDLVVSGNYVFVAAAGFPAQSCVVDVSDPSAMSIVWSGMGGQEVDLHGNTLYLRNGADLDAFDLTNLPNVTHLGEVLGSRVIESVINGDRLYVGWHVGGGDELRIYDVSGPDPLNPALLGSITFVGTANDPAVLGLAVEGNYAYTIVKYRGNSDYRVHIVDVSNPASAAVVGTYLWGNPSALNPNPDIAVSDGYVYVTDPAIGATPLDWNSAKGLVVLDVSNPALPTAVATYKTHGALRGVRVSDDRAYLFDDGEGLIVMDVSSPSNPIRLGNYHSPAYLRKMAKAGDLLYIVDQWNGLTILDVSDPNATPTVVGVYQTPFTPTQNLGVDNWAVSVQANRAYLTAGYAGLQAIDVSDPSQPVLISAAPPPAGFAAKGLAMTGNVAHIGVESGQASFFQNYNVSNPQSMTLLGSVTGGGGQCAKTIAVNPQGIAFTARDYEKPQRINTGAGGQVPYQSPVILSPPGGDTLPGVGVNFYRPRDCALNGDYWYIINRQNPSQGGGLYVKNVSDPLNPVDVNTVPLATVGGIAHQNGRLYVMTGNGTPRIFDIATDPASPVQIASSFGLLGTQGGWTHLVVEEPYMYVSSALGTSELGVGLIVVKVNGLPSDNPADLNGDGVVNTLDLGILLAGWTIPPRTAACGGTAPCPADINHDGVVNTLDLGILLSSWTL